MWRWGLGQLPCSLTLNSYGSSCIRCVGLEIVPWVLEMVTVLLVMVIYCDGAGAVGTVLCGMSYQGGDSVIVMVNGDCVLGW